MRTSYVRWPYESDNRERAMWRSREKITHRKTSFPGKGTGDGRCAIVFFLTSETTIHNVKDDRRREEKGTTVFSSLFVSSTPRVASHTYTQNIIDLSWNSFGGRLLVGRTSNLWSSGWSVFIKLLLLCGWCGCCGSYV